MSEEKKKPTHFFKISLDDRPHLLHMKESGQKEELRNLLKVFADAMEVAAKEKWYDLPQHIHTSLSLGDLVLGVLNAVMTTNKINEEAHAALGYDLHPLALLSDKRKNIVTDEQEMYDWKSHFILSDNEVTRETLERLIRKMLYLMRWFDVETVSKSLLAREFPVMDSKDIEKLPFQPALRYQKEKLGDLWLGKFHHEVGALNCGEIDSHVEVCPACQIGDLYNVKEVMVCVRCNAAYTVKEDITI